MQPRALQTIGFVEMYGHGRVCFPCIQDLAYHRNSNQHPQHFYEARAALSCPTMAEVEKKLKYAAENTIEDCCAIA